MRGHPLGLGELPREHAAGADVARLARLDDIVQGLHRLLDRGLRIPAVDLVQVDVVEAERSSEASIEAMMCLRERPEPFSPGIVGHGHLGGQHVLLAHPEQLASSRR